MSRLDNSRAMSEAMALTEERLTENILAAVAAQGGALDAAQTSAVYAGGENLPGGFFDSNGEYQDYFHAGDILGVKILAP